MILLETNFHIKPEQLGSTFRLENRSNSIRKDHICPCRNQVLRYSNCKASGILKDFFLLHQEITPSLINWVSYFSLKDTKTLFSRAIEDDAPLIEYHRV